MGKRSQSPSKANADGRSPGAKTSLLLGAHMSIAGGIHLAVGRGEEVGCTAIQIFTKNATQWVGRSPTEADIDKFRSECRRTGIIAVAHDSYLINLGSPETDLRLKSIDAFVDEMERAEELDLPYVIMHPGAHRGAGDDAGIAYVVESFSTILKRTSGFRVRILVENTAGQGTSLGHSVEHLTRIVNGPSAPERLGICIDSCHAFVAGHNIGERQGYDEFSHLLDEQIGLDRLGALHLNDCKKGLGSRVDRHEHIGRGALGLDFFRFVMNDPRFASVPKLLETPKELGGQDMDPINLGILKGLVEGAQADGEGVSSENPESR
jgi:deoxyribonuclease IV